MANSGGKKSRSGRYVTTTIKKSAVSKGKAVKDSKSRQLHRFVDRAPAEVVLRIDDAPPLKLGIRLNRASGQYEARVPARVLPGPPAERAVHQGNLSPQVRSGYAPTTTSYLRTDSTDAVAIVGTLQASMALARSLGYFDSEISTVKRGSFVSWFASKWAEGEEKYKEQAVDKATVVAREVDQAVTRILAGEKSQSESVSNTASAVSALIDSVAQYDNAISLTDRILIITHTDENGKTSLRHKYLTLEEKKLCDEYPEILSNADNALHRLAEYSKHPPSITGGVI